MRKRILKLVENFFNVSTFPTLNITQPQLNNEFIENVSLRVLLQSNLAKRQNKVRNKYKK